MTLGAPKVPNEPGWVDDPIATAVSMQKRAEVFPGNTNPFQHLTWNHGALRVGSSCELRPDGPLWIVSVSRYNRRPPDYVVANVRRLFGMVDAVEVEAGNHQRCRILMLGDETVKLPVEMVVEQRVSS